MRLLFICKICFVRSQRKSGRCCDTEILTKRNKNYNNLNSRTELSKYFNIETKMDNDARVVDFRQLCNELLSLTVKANERLCLLDIQQLKNVFFVRKFPKFCIIYHEKVL